MKASLAAGRQFFMLLVFSVGLGRRSPSSVHILQCKAVHGLMGEDSCSVLGYVGSGEGKPLSGACRAVLSCGFQVREAASSRVKAEPLLFFL